jgi:hypothetical protein
LKTSTEIEITSNPDTSKVSSILEFEDRERRDVLSFTTYFLEFGTGTGFQNINNIYTNYLSTLVEHENYLVNRTSPKYLQTKYLSKSFGTGRYFLVYEDVNLQNNFLFNLFSIGPMYGILLFLAVLALINQNFKKGIKASLLILIISSIII